MFLIVGIVLLVLWLGGFLVFHITAAAIHLLLILAIIAIVWNFVSGRRAL